VSFRTIIDPALLRHALSFTLSVLLLVQGAMPSGYMPSAIDGGWPVMLCPDGLPENFLSDRSHQHHHSPETVHGSNEDGPSSDENSTTDYCPLGSALDTAVIAGLPGLPAASPIFAVTQSGDYLSVFPAAVWVSGHPRAPPVS